MPLYEYACQRCAHHFEVQQKISDDLLKTCPKCQEEALERLVSRTSFALKGSGWYADGYGAKGGSSTGSGSGSASAKSETTPAASTPETKPKDSTPETKPKADPPKPASKDGGD